MREPRNSGCGPSTKRRSRRASANSGGCLARLIDCSFHTAGCCLVSSATSYSRLRASSVSYRRHFHDRTSESRQLLAEPPSAQKAVVGYLRGSAATRPGSRRACCRRRRNRRKGFRTPGPQTRRNRQRRPNAKVAPDQLGNSKGADQLGWNSRESGCSWAKKLPGSSPADVLAGAPRGKKSRADCLPEQTPPPAETPTGAGTLRRCRSSVDQPSCRRTQPHLPAGGCGGAVKTTPLDNRYRDTYKRAIDAKNQCCWVGGPEALRGERFPRTASNPPSGFSYQGSETTNPTSLSTRSDWRSAISATARVRWRTGSSLKPTER